MWRGVNRRVDRSKGEVLSLRVLWKLETKKGWKQAVNVVSRWEIDFKESCHTKSGSETTNQNLPVPEISLGLGDVPQWHLPGDLWLSRPILGLEIFGQWSLLFSSLWWEGECLRWLSLSEAMKCSKTRSSYDHFVLSPFWSLWKKLFQS